MVGRRVRCGAMVATLGLAMAGCASTIGGAGVAATTLPARSISTSASSPAPTVRSTVIEDRVVPTVRTTTEADSDYLPPSECLMTVADVSSVLEGRWSREPLGDGGCTFHSDRGAVFTVGPVDYPPSEFDAGLADARIHSCDTDPVDVPGTGGGFVCTETLDGEEYVEGNIVAQGYFWLFVLPPVSTDPGHSAETDAMVALLGAVRQ